MDSTRGAAKKACVIEHIIVWSPPLAYVALACLVPGFYQEDFYLCSIAARINFSVSSRPHPCSFFESSSGGKRRQIHCEITGLKRKLDREGNIHLLSKSSRNLVKIDSHLKGISYLRKIPTQGQDQWTDSAQ